MTAASTSPTPLVVSVRHDESVTALVYPAESPSRAVCILAHGAGAGQRSPFMAGFARGLTAYQIDVVTFDFPYMEQGRRMPDRAPVLESCFEAVIQAVERAVARARSTLVIGGKSMGGRIASQCLAASPLPVAGLVLLGYPLHPPGQPHKRRDGHLASVHRPMLFVQGDRDAFGTPAELEPALDNLSPPAVLHVVPGGDHSFKVAGAGNSEQQAILAEVQRVVASWIRSL